MKQYQVGKIIECAKRLVEHSDAKLGGCLSEDSKSSEIPSNAISHVKARHLAGLRNALKSETCSELPTTRQQPLEQTVQMQYEGVVMLEFTGVPSRKVEQLLQDGWQVNGVSIERTNEDGTVSRGAVTTGGMVLWWNNEQDTADAVRYGYIRQGNGFTVKCKKATIVHGPNPEKDYGNALDKAIDEKIGETK